MNPNFSTIVPSKEITHTFYLIEDAGNSPLGSSSIGLQALKHELSKASKHRTALFSGDNIYPDGMPNKKEKGSAFTEH